MRQARFYVYAITLGGEIAYIGKGSGRRLQSSMSKHRLPGHEIARFFKECDAYAFEKKAIDEFRPWRNKAPGGGGSRAQRPKPTGNKPEWAKIMEKLGSRVYAARLLDANWEKLAPFMDDPSWSMLQEIRAVAYAG